MDINIFKVVILKFFFDTAGIFLREIFPYVFTNYRIYMRGIFFPFTLLHIQEYYLPILAGSL